MLLKQLFDQDTWTYTYLLADPDTGEAIIIDSVLERVDRDLQLIAELNLKLIYALDTHVHADHITGAGELRRRTGAKSGVAAVAGVSCADHQLEHGQTLAFGSYKLEARSTPGHTSGCMTFVVNTNAKNFAFTGDALFIRGCGRTDFQEGDSATLRRSVYSEIFSLPDDTVVYPGHDYRGHTTSTVGEEKSHNPRLKTDITEAGFVKIMDGLNLSYPKRIHEALPANLLCGSGKPEKVLPKQVSVENLGAFSGRFLDVRGVEEAKQAGHLPQAEIVPLPELIAGVESWDRNSAILVICGTGNRSSRACVQLQEMGFSDLSNLERRWHDCASQPRRTG